MELNEIQFNEENLEVTRDLGSAFYESDGDGTDGDGDGTDGTDGDGTDGDGDGTDSGESADADGTDA